MYVMASPVLSLVDTRPNLVAQFAHTFSSKSIDCVGLYGCEFDANLLQVLCKHCKYLASIRKAVRVMKAATQSLDGVQMRLGVQRLV